MANLHTADHGELIVLYLGAMLTLALTGARPYSLDHLIAKRRLARHGSQSPSRSLIPPATGFR
jgi:hypothetical protein